MPGSPPPQGISGAFNSTPIRIFHTPTTEQAKIESEPSSPITDVFYFKLTASETAMPERKERRGYSVQPPNFPSVIRPTIFPPIVGEASHALEAIARDGTPRNEILAPKKRSKTKQLSLEGTKIIDSGPSITHRAPTSQNSFGGKTVSAGLASPSGLESPKLGDRQRGLALQKIIREIESSLWMAKKPSPHLAMIDEEDARRLGVEGDAPYSLKAVDSMSFLKGAYHFSNNLAVDVSSSDTIDVMQAARKVMPKREAVCMASEGSVAITEQYTTTVKQHISAGPKTVTNTEGSLFLEKALNSSIQPSTRILPHLRSFDPTTANHLPKRGNVLNQPAKMVSLKSLFPAATVPNAPTKTAGIATDNSNRVPLPPVKKAPNFKIPQNPHAAGYNIAAVLRDPNERVDVKGLKFTAWPKPANRGDMPIQEARAVIISDLPLQPTLTMISLVCKNTGKLEDVVIDVVRRKVLVTFIEAAVAHNFYTQAQKSLEFVSRNSKDGTTVRKRLFVQMDYPIDMLPYGIQERIFSGKGSRMVFFGGWEKHSLEKLVGNGTGEYEELDVLLMRLAESYVQGGKTGRVEGVTFKEEGWGFYEGGLLYASIREGIAAFDGLKLEPEFKGCNVRFGKDPCELSC